MGNHPNFKLKKNVTYPHQHKLQIVPKSRKAHMVTTPFKLCKPIHQRPKHSKTRQSHPFIAQTLQANKTALYYTLVNVVTIHNKPPYSTIHWWLLTCTCHCPPCHCMARLHLDVLCILGSTSHTQTLLTPSPSLKLQFIELTYSHDTFPTYRYAKNQWMEK